MKYCQDCFDELELETGKTLHIVHEANPDDPTESTCEHCHTNGHTYLYEPVHEYNFTSEEINQALDACNNEECLDCPLYNLGDTKQDCIQYLLRLVTKI